jgi:hypothetical protein
LTIRQRREKDNECYVDGAGQTQRKKGKFGPPAPLLCICGCMRNQRLEALKMIILFKEVTANKSIKYL